jgi:2-polyprenyl-3-methyl-5-hydroxy-6-metoxy-1,4-benzoquinol methylase
MVNQQQDSWEINFSFRKEELESRGDKTYWEVLVPVFKNAVRGVIPHGTVLDVGCGLGYLTNEIAPDVEKITGIDPAGKVIEFAKDKFRNRNTEFVDASILDFEKENQDCRYDICIANMVFHNIGDLDINIRAIHHLLNRQGYLLFSIPHPAFWYSTRSYFDGKSFFYEKEKSYQLPFKIRNFKQHPSLITYWHRSLEHYVEILKKSNFIITSIKEPALPGGHSVKDILFFVCRKT